MESFRLHFSISYGNLSRIPFAQLFERSVVMRTVISPVFGGALFSAVFFCASAFVVHAEHESTQLLITSSRGQAAYSADGVHWLPVSADAALGKGALIRTGGSSTADVLLKSSGTALRMLPNTLLSVTRLEKQVAGEEIITWTVLDLKAGGVIASQQKMDRLSSFQINTAAGPVAIGGTEYLVQADGTVRCFTGRIWVNGDSAAYAAAINVPAGFSFDPVTRMISPIGASLVTMVSPDLEVVRHNSRSLKKESGEIVMNMTTERKVSPGQGQGGNSQGGNNNNQGGGGQGGNSQN
jgi:hypothetical protein